MWMSQHLHDLHLPKDLLQVVVVQLRLVHDFDRHLRRGQRQREDGFENFTTNLEPGENMKERGSPRRVAGKSFRIPKKKEVSFASDLNGLKDWCTTDKR